MKMRLTLAATMVAAMFSASAMAADMRLKAPPPAAPALLWNSCYVGVNAGWVGSRSEITLTSDPFFWGGPNIIDSFGSNTLTTSGGTAGAEWGCNWQFGAAVFGYEGDLEWTDINATFDTFFPGCDDCGVNAYGGGNFVAPRTFHESVSSRWLSTSRFRAGWASGPWLLFATGGIAVAKISVNDQVVGFDNGFGAPPTFWNVLNRTDTKVGWTVGGGFEWLIFGNWSVKAEYLYIDLGRMTDVSCVSDSPGCGLIRHDHTLREQIARVGLNYFFNWGPGPMH
jgi:outer membrane immunogenic protein